MIYLYSIKIKEENTMTTLEKVQEFGRLVKMYQATGDVKYYRMAMAISINL